jgi:hypothetical protein
LLKIMGIHLNTLELHWARPCRRWTHDKTIWAIEFYK